MVQGSVGILADSIEYALLPLTRTELPEAQLKKILENPLLRFNATIPIQSGWFNLYLRSKGKGVRQANPVSFGVGNVFVIAGQSNATGSSHTLMTVQSPYVRKGQLQGNEKIRWMKGDDPQIMGGLSMTFGWRYDLQVL